MPLDAGLLLVIHALPSAAMAMSNGVAVGPAG